MNDMPLQGAPTMPALTRGGHGEIIWRRSRCHD
jgi:hypothetical protein